MYWAELWQHFKHVSLSKEPGWGRKAKKHTNKQTKQWSGTAGCQHQTFHRNHIHPGLTKLTDDPALRHPVNVLRCWARGSDSLLFSLRWTVHWGRHLELTAWVATGELSICLWAWQMSHGCSTIRHGLFKMSRSLTAACQWNLNSKSSPSDLCSPDS